MILRCDDLIYLVLAQFFNWYLINWSSMYSAAGSSYGIGIWEIFLYSIDQILTSHWSWSFSLAEILISEVIILSRLYLGSTKKNCARLVTHRRKLCFHHNDFTGLQQLLFTNATPYRRLSESICFVIERVIKKRS